MIHPSDLLRPRIDRHFARYCRTGSPRELAAVFDASVGELWRVAAHLAASRHDAEDAVQNTFLAAIEHRDRWDPARPVLPWLLGLLANRVREQRRRAARSPDAARAGAGDDADPAVVAAEREFHERVAAAVQCVAAPFRAVVERHLLGDADPAEIAAELGVPAATVRSRLHRGLAQLRRRLPWGGFGAFVPPGLRPETVAALRAVVLGRAGATGPVVAAGASGWVVIAGWLLAAGVVVGVAGAMRAWGETGAVQEARAERVVAERAGTGAERGGGAGASHADAAESATAPSSATASSTAVERSPAEPVDPAGEGVLHLLVRNAATQQPLADVAVRITHEAPPRTAPAGGDEGAAVSVPVATTADQAPEDLTVRTDERGTATLRFRSGPARVLPQNGVPKPSRVVVVAGTTTEHVHDVPVVFTADVMVVDEAGQPVAGAVIRGVDPAQQKRTLAAREVGRTGLDGRWREPRTEAMLFLQALQGGRQPSAVLQANSGKGPLVLQLGGPAGEIHGTVCDAAGRPLPGTVLAFLTAARREERFATAVEVADASGHFACRCLPIGDVLVFARLEDRPDHRFARIAAVAAVPGAPPTELRFPRGAEVRVRVADPQGHPLVVPCSVGLMSMDLPIAVRDWAWRRERVAEDGCARFVGLDAGSYDLVVDAPHRSCRQTVDVHDGAVIELPVTIDVPEPLELEVVDETGRPIPGIGIHLVIRNGNKKRIVTDDRGRALFAMLTPGEHVVLVEVGPNEFGWTRHAVSTGKAHRLVLDRRERTGGIVGRLVADADAGGVLGEPAIVLSRSEDNDPSRGGLSSTRVRVDCDKATGAFRCIGLLPGKYDLLASDLDHFGVFVRRLDVEVRDGAIDVGDLVLGGGTLTVAARGAAEALESGIGLAAVCSRAVCFEPIAAKRTDPDHVKVTPVSEGQYQMLVWDASHQPVFTDVVVRRGLETSIEVTQAKGIETSLVIPKASVLLDVRFPDGRRIWQILVGGSGPFVRGFAPGKYHAEFTAVGGDRFAADFTVGETPGEPVRFEPVR